LTDVTRDPIDDELSEDWTKSAKVLEDELGVLERDIREKEMLEDALIRKGREVLQMRARVAELHEQIKEVTQDRDALAEALNSHPGPASRQLPRSAESAAESSLRL